MPPSATPPQTRSSQRTVLACSSCVQRKTRCTKTIPCGPCIRRNKAATCQREDVVVIRRGNRGRQSQAPADTDTSCTGGPSLARAQHQEDSSASAQPREEAIEVHTSGTYPDGLQPASDVSPAQSNNTVGDANCTAIPSLLPPDASDYNLGQQQQQSFDSSVPGLTNEILAQILTLNPSAVEADTRLTNEAAATLEFLAHGRRNALDRLSGRQSSRPAATLDASADTSPMNSMDEGQHWDTYFAPNVARMLLALHQAHLSWMHNVVHLPSFRQEFEDNLLQPRCDQLWLALYYALLSHTLYHLDESYLSSLPQAIIANAGASRLLFEKSTQTLFDAGFMDEHRLTSVQCISILVQVAHNIDKADKICILISAAIRISQCLNLHRLGADPPTNSTTVGRDTVIDHQTKKRVWWFLVRYDWLQIPFQNTCLIHPAQFTTPMPENAYDDSERMFHNGVVYSYPDDVCTSSTWTNYLNRLALVFWKHQNGVFNIKQSENDPEYLFKLYDQVMWADEEIKDVYSSLPSAARDIFETGEVHRERALLSSFPVDFIPGIVHVCTAHKILSVHRQFQLSGFRDRRFAFSQLSCVSIAERSLEAIQRWPDNPMSSICRRMWTTLTHVISSSIILVLALLYKSQSRLMHDVERIRHYVNVGKEFIAREEHTSSIARRGARLIRALMDLEYRSDFSIDIEADIGSLVRRVALEGGSGGEDMATDALQNILPLDQGLWQAFMSWG